MPNDDRAMRLIRLLLERAANLLRHRAKVGVVAHVMGIRVVALAGNVCSGLLTASLLGPDGRGEQAALIVAPTVFAAVCTFGLHASLIYNLRADPENGSCYFGSAMILTSFVSLFAMGLGFFLLPFWLGRYSEDTVTFARLLLLAVPLGIVTPLLSGVLEANGHFGLANRVLYVQSLGALGMIGVLAGLRWLTPASAATAYVLPSIVSFFYLLMQARRVLRPRLTLIAPYPQRLLRYGIRFYGVDLVGALSGYFDQVVIVFFLQPAAMGAYAVALSLSRVLYVAQGAVATVLFPSIAAREPTNVVDIVARATRVTTAVNITGAVSIAIAGPSLLLLLYGHRFAAAVAPFLVLLAEAVVSSAARTLAQAFSGTGRPSVVTGVEVAGVVASLTMMLILVPVYGIVGAACATLIGGFVRLASVLASFEMVLGISLPRLVISRADVDWVTGL